MATWGEFEEAEPDFATQVKALFDAGRHKTIATVRADGSPRISGIECVIADGQLTMGSIGNARKGADLKRDPRFALHGPTFHPVEGKEGEWPGEVKVAGTVTLTESSPEADAFVADIIEVAFTHLNPEATRLVVEWWTPVNGLQRVERD
ncbi:MAG: hypothetical protein QOG90_2068 [Actinomycetota bacterium]